MQVSVTLGAIHPTSVDVVHKSSGALVIEIDTDEKYVEAVAGLLHEELLINLHVGERTRHVRKDAAREGDKYKKTTIAISLAGTGHKSPMSLFVDQARYTTMVVLINTQSVRDTVWQEPGVIRDDYPGDDEDSS